MRDQNPFQKAAVLLRAAGDEQRNTPPLEIRCSGLTAVATRCLYSFVHGRSKEGSLPSYTDFSSATEFS